MTPKARIMVIVDNDPSLEAYSIYCPPEQYMAIPIAGTYPLTYRDRAGMHRIMAAKFKLDIERVSAELTFVPPNKLAPHQKNLYDSMPEGTTYFGVIRSPFQIAKDLACG